MSVAAFEFRRAVSASFGVFALIGLILSAAFLCGLAMAGRAIVGGADPNLTLGTLGFLWATVAGVHAADRNRGTLIEDIWWGLEARPIRQVIGLYLAWGVVAAVQGAFVAIFVGMATGATAAGAGNYLLGFIAGVPGGVVQCAISRRMPGATVLSGLAVFAAMFYIGPLTNASSKQPPVDGAAAYASLGVYCIVAVLLTYALTRRLPR